MPVYANEPHEKQNQFQWPLGAEWGVEVKSWGSGVWHFIRTLLW